MIYGHGRVSTKGQANNYHNLCYWGFFKKIIMLCISSFWFILHQLSNIKY